MKYTREERLEIGRRIYAGELTRFEAAEKYGICADSARDYMRMYRDANVLPSKNRLRVLRSEAPVEETIAGIERYGNMSKEELIRELIEVRIREARLKKGYIVKGVGAERQIVFFGKGNTK